LALTAPSSNQCRRHPFGTELWAHWIEQKKCAQSAVAFNKVS